LGHSISNGLFGIECPNLKRAGSVFDGCIWVERIINEKKFRSQLISKIFI